MDDRPVRPAEWTSCEIVAEVEPDAQFMDFGVTAIGRGRVWVDEVTFDIVPEEQVAAARTAIRRQYGDRTSLTGFRFTGPAAIAAVQTVSTREGFVYVETYQDTWQRTSDGWSLAQRVSVASYYEAPEPDAETVGRWLRTSAAWRLPCRRSVRRSAAIASRCTVRRCPRALPNRY